MDPHSLVLAVDDGYFPPSYKARAGKTVIVGVLYRSHPLDVLTGVVEVDGSDATERVLEMCRAARPDLLLLDNVIYAGFNYVDASRIHRVCGTPIIIVIKHRLDPGSILVALKKHFPDWEERWAAISKPVSKNVEVETKKGRLAIYTVGISVAEAVDAVSTLQVYSRIPEPLRVADLAASAIARELLKARLL